jgi:hypothetical protein
MMNSSSSTAASVSENSIDMATNSLIRAQPCSTGGAVTTAGNTNSPNAKFVFQIEKVTVDNYFK